MTRMAFWLLIISMSASAQVPGLPTRASGSSSSSNSGSDFWVDAGAGYIYADAVVRNADAGTALHIQAASTGAVTEALKLTSQTGAPVLSSPALVLYSEGNTAAARHGWIFASKSTNTGIQQGLQFYTPSGYFTFTSGGSVPATTNSIAARINPNGEIESYAASSANAFATLTTGARIDFGAGASDYAVSDGTGIETPTYWESTRALTAGPGLIANVARVSGGASSVLTSANATAAGAGALLNNTSFGEVWQGQGTSFKPLGAPHNAIDRQTLSTRILGTAKTTYPEVVERIPCDSFGGTGATVQMYWSRSATTTTTSATGRTYLGLLTGDASQQAYGYTACSSANTVAYTTVLGATATSGHLNYCQRLQAGSDITNAIYWSLLTSATPANDATTLAAPGFGFRYAASVGTHWYACYYNGSNTCVDTGVTVTASGEYLLCAYQTGSNLLTFAVNGLVTNTAATISSLSNAYPLVWVDATSGSLKALGVGPLTVESE